MNSDLDQSLELIGVLLAAISGLLFLLTRAEKWLSPPPPVTPAPPRVDPLAPEQSPQPPPDQ